MHRVPPLAPNLARSGSATRRPIARAAATPCVRALVPRARARRGFGRQEPPHSLGTRTASEPAAPCGTSAASTARVWPAAPPRSKIGRVGGHAPPSRHHLAAERTRAVLPPVAVHLGPGWSRKLHPRDGKLPPAHTVSCKHRPQFLREHEPPRRLQSYSRHAYHPHTIAHARDLQQRAPRRRSSPDRNALRTSPHHGTAHPTIAACQAPSEGGTAARRQACGKTYAGNSSSRRTCGRSNHLELARKRSHDQCCRPRESREAVRIPSSRRDCWCLLRHRDLPNGSREDTLTSFERWLPGSHCRCGNRSVRGRKKYRTSRRFQGLLSRLVANIGWYLASTVHLFLGILYNKVHSVITVWRIFTCAHGICSRSRHCIQHIDKPYLAHEIKSTVASR